MKQFNGRLGDDPVILYVNVQWCGHCKRARPIMEKLSQHLGMSLSVVDVDGDKWGDYLQRVMGPGAPTSYPTILYVEDGRATSFEDERTFRNLTDFACAMAGTCRD
jgi:thiol-disulfide isomerase/thioredoxin